MNKPNIVFCDWCERKIPEGDTYAVRLVATATSGRPLPPFEYAVRFHQCASCEKLEDEALQDVPFCEEEGCPHGVVDEPCTECEFKWQEFDSPATDQRLNDVFRRILEFTDAPDPEEAAPLTPYKRRIIEPCDRPPPGWACSREKDHKGPCCAWPNGSDFDRWSGEGGSGG